MKRRRIEVPWDFQRLDCPLQSEVNLRLLLLWLHYPRRISPSLLSVLHPPTSCAACPQLRMRSSLKRDRYLEPNIKKWMNDERINVTLQFVVIFFVQFRDVSDLLTMTIHIYVLLNDFVGAFAKLLKATTSFFVSVLLSVRLCAWNNSASTGQTFVKFDIRVLFENLSRKLNIHWICHE